MNHINEIEISNQEEDFPKGFLNLYSSVKIESPSDSFTLLLHSVLLEIGFIPNDVESDNVYQQMPENWKSNGIFKIKYYHKTVPEALCWVTCVPLLKSLAVEGSLESQSSDENNVHKLLSIKNFIDEKEDILNPAKLFIQVKQLIKILKDEFCFALLALVQQSVNYEPAFGLNGLIEDIEISLMKLLPVEAVVSLSGVNKHFHRQANMPNLWKFMLQRDFKSVTSMHSDTEENWKELYKVEYLRRKRQQEFRPTPLIYVPSDFYFPPRSPNHYFDPRINMDPALQMWFPQMRSRFQRSDWPYGWDATAYRNFRF